MKGGWPIWMCFVMGLIAGSLLVVNANLLRIAEALEKLQP